MTKKFTNRSAALAVLLAFVGLVTLGCNKSETARNAAPKTQSVSVRLKWVHQAQFAGFYIAEHKGFYRDAGLNVALNAGGVDFPAIQMVAGGDETFGVTGADQLILAREKGVPVTAISVIYRRSPMVLFSLADSKIITPADFVGRRVGVKLGGNEELTYRAMMKAAHVDTNKVKEIPVKYDMTPLFAHKVDVWPGYLINEPLVAEEHGFKINLISPLDYGIDLYADSLFTTEKIIRIDPGMVHRFVDATLKGWDYAIQHPDEAVKDTLLYGKNLSGAHELKMMQASIPLIKPDSYPVGYMDEQHWQEMIDTLYAQGFSKTQPRAQTVFTSAFLNDKP